MIMNVSFFHLIRNPVEFVTAASNTTEKVNTRQQRSAGISGGDAKKIYEQIISEESSASLHEEAQERKPNTAPIKQKLHMGPSSQYTSKDLFCASQVGDLKTVQSCICTSNLDVNCVDSYCWTPLMIASYEGHAEVVLYLLSEGAQWIDQVRIVVSIHYGGSIKSRTEMFSSSSGK